MRWTDLRDLPPIPELPTGYAIRLLREGEDEALTDVLIASFPETPWDLEKARRGLILAPDVEAIYVAEYGDEFAATASARYDPVKVPGSGYVHWVGVHPDHRRKGLGKWLTVRVLEHFRDAGCRDAVLETDDFRIPAIELYLALGFVPEHDHPDHAARWQRIEEVLGHT